MHACQGAPEQGLVFGVNEDPVFPWFLCLQQSLIVGDYYPTGILSQTDLSVDH